ncbi:Abi family protein [Castellaniella defragrans]|uniref:Abi family protein n=1 Tax=Castellaniella defragrans TaxID=75697 RepID=UPI000A027BAF|nr:Abi family protein [Castellaniella defragrans]
MKYTKQALSEAQLLARWRDKGLIIKDEPAALNALQFVGYFRLRGYALSLMTAANGQRMFRPGVTFDDIIRRYDFDRELRRITLGQLERIEVAIRTVISNHMSLHYGPFWYINHPQQVLGQAPGPRGKPVPFQIGKLLADIERDTHRSKDLFAQHYYAKYTDPLLPPSWLVAECITFRQWSNIYEHLQKADPQQPNPKKEVARTFGLSVPLVGSWLHVLSILRNTCAHHGRIWNRRFVLTPETYQQAQSHFADPRSYYCLAVVMRLFTKPVDMNDEWPIRLSDLLKAYPDIPPQEMGFPNNWDADDLWNS